MEVGLNTELCHIIGHSLGAHLAGYAGYHLRTDFRLKLGRITGTVAAKSNLAPSGQSGLWVNQVSLSQQVSPRGPTSAARVGNPLDAALDMLLQGWTPRSPTSATRTRWCDWTRRMLPSWT